MAVEEGNTSVIRTNGKRKREDGDEEDCRSRHGMKRKMGFGVPSLLLFLAVERSRYSL